MPDHYYRIATITTTVSLRSLLPYRYDRATTASLQSLLPSRYDRYYVLTVSLRSLLCSRYDRYYVITVSLRSLLRSRYDRYYVLAVSLYDRFCVLTTFSLRSLLRSRYDRYYVLAVSLRSLLRSHYVLATIATTFSQRSLLRSRYNRYYVPAMIATTSSCGFEIESSVLPYISHFFTTMILFSHTCLRSTAREPSALIAQIAISATAACGASWTRLGLFAAVLMLQTSFACTLLSLLYIILATFPILTLWASCGCCTPERDTSNIWISRWLHVCSWLRHCRW